MVEAKTFEERRAYALSWLDACWGCEYWSRDEQAFAMAEGWSLEVFASDESNRQDRIDFMEGVFRNTQEAVAYVMQMAEMGSPLHARALILHLASVLKYGND